ncbi:MAG: tol-pal system protein YbgF [Pseudomonadota bacterium]
MQSGRITVWATAAAVFLTAAGGAAWAQDSDQTLADIRQELSVLYVEVQRLKRELSTTGGVGAASVGGTVIDRVAAIEGELQRLTQKTEQLEFRVDSVVRDGTNRIEDLEFRVCELDAGCDIAAFEPGSTLGGVEPATGGADAGGAGAASVTPLTDSGVELAVGEQADFDAAMAMLSAGDFTTAAAQFAQFQTNYPGSPLGARAGLKRGEALENTGDLTGAARVYLDTFSAAPQGPEAPEALYLVGRSLGRLGKTQEACVTLGEVPVRFPDAPAAAQARAEQQQLGCS